MDVSTSFLTFAEPAQALLIRMSRLVPVEATGSAPLGGGPTIATCSLMSKLTLRRRIARPLLVATAGVAASLTVGCGAFGNLRAIECDGVDKDQPICRDASVPDLKSNDMSVEDGSDHD